MYTRNKIEEIFIAIIKVKMPNEKLYVRDEEELSERWGQVF